MGGRRLRWSPYLCSYGGAYWPDSPSRNLRQCLFRWFEEKSPFYDGQPIPLCRLRGDPRSSYQLEAKRPSDELHRHFAHDSLDLFGRTHFDGIPGASIQEGAVRPFTCALLTPNTQKWVY